MKSTSEKHHHPGAALPASILRKLANAPRHGDGVHRWLFTMALQLHPHRRPEDIEKLLAIAVKDCGRDVPPSEIRNAVKDSGPGSRRGSGTSSKSAVPFKPTPKWPTVDETRRAKVIEGCPSGLEEIKRISPIIISGDEPNTYWFLEALFTSDHLLCLGLDQSHFVTHPRDNFLTAMLTNSCVIVPSPMTHKHGFTQQGKRSQHTLDNTGERRFLVTEFDSGSPDEQSALILDLREYAPLVMVLSSGGKSLHAWWNCVGTTEDMQRQFFHYAVRLGADPSMWTKSQFARLPQGWRADKETRQQVYYFDPATLAVDGVAEEREEA